MSPASRTMRKDMRKDAYLINIARGQLIQEGALHRALTESWIAGRGGCVVGLYG
jgi:lactate dehydrogenase-like 2-hydroxyacid dehydrogenase